MKARLFFIGLSVLQPDPLQNDLHICESADKLFHVFGLKSHSIERLKLEARLTGDARNHITDGEKILNASIHWSEQQANVITTM